MATQNQRQPLSNSERTWITLLGIYIVLLTVICLTLLIQLYTVDFSYQQTTTIENTDPLVENMDNEAPASTEENPQSTGQIVLMVPLLFWQVSMSADTQLLFLVIVAGALGGLVHDIRSYKWYIGNNAFVINWVPFYLLQPLAGAALAVLFYLAIRGGFFTGVEKTNLFGFVALAGLIGLFNEQAIIKLKQIAETIFLQPKPGADHYAEDTSNTAPATNQEPSSTDSGERTSGG